MYLQHDRTWLEVDLGVIERNYLGILKKIGGESRIMAVLKANAYGLGAVRIAEVFQKLGCPFLAVATFEEAAELRENGIETPILILGPINPSYTALAVENGFHLAIVDFAQAKAFSDIAESYGKKVAGHIKVDSGLSRLGFVIRNHFDEVVKEMEKVLSLPGLDIVGVFTHTSAFCGRDAYSAEREELELFRRVLSWLRTVRPSLGAHCLSSSTLLQFPEYSYNFVRIGVLYMGTYPEYSSQFGVSQAVGLKTRIMQIKTLDEGTPVSYGATFATSRLTRIALVPVGYADGLRRSLSNRGAMIVCGKKAPVIGKMCCDYTILDITDIPEAKHGDIVTIFGRDGKEAQYPYDYAELYPASVSEVTATLTSRVPRVYLRDANNAD